jgi:type III secretory pathway component EscU
MKSVSNIVFSIMMGILMVFVSVWYFVMFLIDTIFEYVEQGTQKIKKLRR